MAQEQKKRSTKRVLNFLRGEPPTGPQDATPVPPPLPEMETDEDLDLTMLPLTRPARKSKLFRNPDDDSTDMPADVNAKY